MLHFHPSRKSWNKAHWNLNNHVLEELITGLSWLFSLERRRDRSERSGLYFFLKHLVEDHFCFSFHSILHAWVPSLELAPCSLLDTLVQNSPWEAQLADFFVCCIKGTSAFAPENVPPLLGFCAKPPKVSCKWYQRYSNAVETTQTNMFRDPLDRASWHLQLATSTHIYLTSNPAFSRSSSSFFRFLSILETRSFQIESFKNFHSCQLRPGINSSAFLSLSACLSRTEVTWVRCQLHWQN